jgi:hypothetical protein
MDNGGSGRYGGSRAPSQMPTVKNFGVKESFFHGNDNIWLQNIHSSDNQNENKIKTQVETRFTPNLGRKMSFKWCHLCMFFFKC